MKTELSHPGITVMRLTALTNAAQALLHALEIDADDLDDWRRCVRRAKSRLSDAVQVARGADLALPAALFRDTADRSAVRLAQDYGLVQRERDDGCAHCGSHAIMRLDGQEWECHDCGETFEREDER